MGSHAVRVETFLIKIDTVWRMVRRGHDQVERRLHSGVLEHELEKMFVIHAPFFLARVRNHLIAAVNFVEALFAAELANSLPTQIATVKKSPLVAELFENGCRLGRQSFAHQRLKVDEGARERQTGNDHTETFDRADSG